MPANTWTPEKIVFLEGIFETSHKKDIMDAIPGSWVNIAKKARKLGLKRDPKLIYEDRINRKPRCDGLQPDEIILLKKIYQNNSKEYILSQFKNRSWHLISKQARKLGIKRDINLINRDRKKRGPRKDSYKQEELNLLKTIYENNTKEFILNEFKKAGFNRSWQSIRLTAKSLNLIRDPEIIKQEMIDGGSNVSEYINDTLWTEKEDHLLKLIYTDNSKEDICFHFPKRTWKAIREHAIKLGLSRTKETVDKDRKKHLKENFNVDSTWQLKSVKEKSRQTNLEKRGVEYPTQSPEVKKKIKNSVQEKYGVDNVFQSEEIKEKIAVTNLKRYGVENPQQSEEIKKKTTDTNIKKYDVENPFQLVDRVQKGMIDKYGKPSPQQVPEIRKKTEEINIKRYGFKTPSENPEIQEKIEITNIEKYGTITPFQNEDVKAKIKETVKKRYGVDNIAQSEKIKNKARQTCMERYGVEYSLQSEEIREKGYQTLKEKGSFSKSQEEEFFLDYLRIFDPDVETQKKHPILKHIIDFYMPKYDLWVQYDGTYWHGKTKRKNKSSRTNKIEKVKKRDELQNKTIMNLVRFWSDDIYNSIKNNTIINLIETKLKEKSNILIEKSSYQYNKKQTLYEEDIKQLDFDPQKVTISDFELSTETLSEEIVHFIKKYEWLETIGTYPKWCFTARYKGFLGGVVLINEPTSYSKLLGDSTPVYEALIQRGATASWAPKNLGSRLIMFSCKWMVHNTEKRFFIGYGDEKAGEIGTLYQACGFDYIGKKYGESHIYQHPEKEGTFTSHSLKRTSSFRKWCKNKNIPLQPHWFTNKGFKDLSNIPQEIKRMWYDWNKKFLNESKKIRVERKHKYVKIIGKDRKETKYLNSLKSYKTYSYPKRFS